MPLFMLALYPNNNNNNKNPNPLSHKTFFYCWHFDPLIHFTFSLTYYFSNSPIHVTFFLPSAYNYKHVAWLLRWWCGRWHHARRLLCRLFRSHRMVAWAGVLLAAFPPSLPLCLCLHVSLSSASMGLVHLEFPWDGDSLFNAQPQLNFNSAVHITC